MTRKTTEQEYALKHPATDPQAFGKGVDRYRRRVIREGRVLTVILSIDAYVQSIAWWHTSTSCGGEQSATAEMALVAEARAALEGVGIACSPEIEIREPSQRQLVESAAHRWVTELTAGNECNLIGIGPLVVHMYRPLSEDEKAQLRKQGLPLI